MNSSTLQRITRTLVAFAFGLVLIGVQSVAAQTVYVATDGNDAFDGSAPEFLGGDVGPLRTISAAVALNPDAIIIEAGDYNTGDDADGITLDEAGVTLQVRQDASSGADVVTLHGTLLVTQSASMLAGEGTFVSNGDLILQAGTLSLAPGVLTIDGDEGNNGGGGLAGIATPMVLVHAGQISGNPPVWADPDDYLFTIDAGTGAATTTYNLNLEVPTRVINFTNSHDAASSVAVAASFTVTGMLTHQSNAPISFSGSLTFEAGAYFDNTTSGSGNFTATGPWLFEDNSVTAIDVANGASLAERTTTLAAVTFAETDNGSYSSTISVAQYSNLVFTGAVSQVESGGGTVAVNLDNAGATTFEATAQLDNVANSGTTTFEAASSIAGNIDNSGTIDNGATLTASFSGTFTELGTIDGANGTLVLTGPAAVINDVAEIEGNLNTNPGASGTTNITLLADGLTVGGTFTVVSGQTDVNAPAITVTTGSFYIANNATYDQNASYLVVLRDFGMGATAVFDTGADVDDEAGRLIFGDGTTGSNGTFAPRPNFAYNGAVVVDKPGRTLTFLQSATFNGPDDPGLGDTGHTDGVTFLVLAGTVDFVDETVIIPNADQAIEVNDITEADTGGIQILGKGVAISGTGEYTNIVVANGATSDAENVQVILNDLSFNATLSALDGGFTLISDLNAVKDSGARYLRNMALDNTKVVEDTGVMNPSKNRYDLELFGAIDYGTLVDDGALGAELTEFLHNLTVRTTGGAVRVVEADMTVDIDEVFNVHGGATINGDGTTLFWLTGASQTHPIVGVVGTSTGDIVQVSGDGSTLQGTGPNSAVRSLLPNVVIDAENVAVSAIHRITGDFTTNDASTVVLTLTQDWSNGFVDNDNGEIDGNMYLNGSSLVLGADVAVDGSTGVLHTAGLFDVADSDVTVNNGDFIVDPDPDATTPGSFNADAAGYVVMNADEGDFGLAGLMISNLRINDYTYLVKTSSVKHMVEINATLEGAAGPVGDLNPDIFLYGSALVTIDAVGNGLAWDSQTSGGFHFRGSNTSLTADGAPVGGNVAFGNVAINVDGTFTLVDDDEDPTNFWFGFGGEFVLHQMGAVSINDETLTYAGPVTFDGDCTDCNYTGSGAAGTNEGALVLGGAAPSSTAIGDFATNGVDVMVARLTQAFGETELQDESILSVGEQLVLSGGSIETYSGGHNGSNTDPYVAQTLNIADGVSIYRSAGYIDGDAVIGGDNTNVTYTGALKNTGSELAETVNNLRVDGPISVHIDGASSINGGLNVYARTVTVCGTFDVNAPVSLDNKGPNGADSDVVLCDGATMLVGVNNPFDAPITGGNDNVLAYDGAGPMWTDGNSWPAGWEPNLRVATSDLWMDDDRTAHDVTFVASAQLNLYGYTLTATGDVTQGGNSVPVYSGSTAMKGSSDPIPMGPLGVLEFAGDMDATWQVASGGWQGPTMPYPNSSYIVPTNRYFVSINKASSSNVVTLQGGNVNFSHGQHQFTAADYPPNMFAFLNGVVHTVGSATIQLWHGVNQTVAPPVQPFQGFIACGTVQGEAHAICDDAPEGGVSGVSGNVQKVVTGYWWWDIANVNVQYPLASMAEAAGKVGDAHGEAEYRGVTLFFTERPQVDVLVTMTHTGYTDPAGVRGFPIDAGTAGPLTNYADMYWTLKTSVSLPPSFQFEASFIANGYQPPVSSPNAELIRLIRRHDLNADNEWILQNGTYDNAKDANDDVTVTLRNAAIGGFVTTGIRFTIGEKNIAPAFTSAPAAAVTVPQDSEWSATYAVEDVDIGDSATMELVAGGDLNGLTFDANTGELVWAVGFDIVPGDYTVTVRATDTNGATSDATTVVTVTKTNRAPEFVQVLTDREVAEGSTLTFTYEAEDADGDAITYTLDAAVDGAEIDEATGVLTFAPDFAQAGSSVTIAVTATDVDGATDQTSATISVKHSVGLCDVTQNNECSALDADWVLQNSAGNRDFSMQQDWAGDVSGANMVTAYDASLILQYDAGFVSTFPAGDPLATKGGDFGSADFVWGEYDWSEGLSARVPVQLDGEVSQVYAVTIRTNVNPTMAKVAGVQVNVPEDWKQLVAYDEETGDLVILAAGAQPIAAATDLANIQLTMVDETAEFDLAATAFINEKTPVELDALNVKQVPTEYDLAQNYPNPFNPTTTIQYSLPQDGKVTLEIYDVTGRLVNMLVNNEQEAGRYRIQWDGRTAMGSQVASGIYIYRLRAGSFVQSKTMMLVK